jgi:hypothetical protein
MAPHVSRFLTRLFQIQPDLDALRSATTAQDDLFRFKIDFVRRRALPLLKGGAHVVSTPEDDLVVKRLAGTARDSDLELAIARGGCALMDREKVGDTSDGLKAEIESLKRWCAAPARSRLPSWVVFRFPKRSTSGIVDAASGAGLPEALLGLHRLSLRACATASKRPTDG